MKYGFTFWASALVAGYFLGVFLWASALVAGYFLGVFCHWVGLV